MAGYTSSKQAGLRKPMAVHVGKKAIGDARVEKMFQEVADAKKRKPRPVRKPMAIRNTHRRKTDERRSQTSKGIAKRKRHQVLRDHLKNIVRKVKRVQGPR